MTMLLLRNKENMDHFLGASCGPLEHAKKLKISVIFNVVSQVVTGPARVVVVTLLLLLLFSPHVSFLGRHFPAH